MRHFLTILLFLLTGLLPAIAQKNNESGQAHNNERIKKIKLSVTNLQGDYLSPVSISKLQIISLCPDTTRLGYVQVGLMNKKISAMSDKPFQAYLQDFADEQYKGLLKDTGLELLWIIKDLRINERTFSMSERAYVRLKADVYVSSDKENYRLILSFDTTLARGGMDVTHKHDKNIAEVIQLLMDASLSGAVQPLRQPTLTLNDILTKEQSLFNSPIFRDKSYKEGVYASYEEFIANAPSVISFDIAVKKRRVQVFTWGKNGSRTLIEHPWGLCKNGELYKYSEDALIPLERSGNAFVISNYLEDINRRNKAIVWTAIAAGAGGGMLGGAVAGAASGYGKGSNIYLVTSIPYIKTHQPEATIIDIDTGELAF